MAATEDELLAAIYANPDDDAPRLVYADWLQERSDPRGEFIALQLQGQSIRPPPGAAGPLAPVVCRTQFRRGFVAGATARFRHQQDVENFGSHVAWATVEELSFGGVGNVRADQREWSLFMGPAMWNVRHAIGPHPRFLLAAKWPRLESLWLDPMDTDITAFRTIAESPLFPKLTQLTAAAEPSWVKGLSRCPPHLAVRTKLAEARKWFAAAPPALEVISILYWAIRYQFSRDDDDEFTRLDVVIELQPKTVPDEVIREVKTAIASLPEGALTHFDASLTIGHKIAAVGSLLEAGAKKVR